MNKYIHYVLLGIILASCTQGQMRNKLATVEKLISQGQVDSAYTQIRKINASNLNKEQDALFNLLYTQITYLSYKPIYSDSAINRSVNYFAKSNNARYYGESLYYKGMICHLLNKKDSAVIFLKKAEAVSNKTNDLDLAHKICNGLVNTNFASANYELVLNYAHKELYHSLKKNDATWIAYAYNHISCAYDKLGKRDSALYYIKKVIPLINRIPDQAKVYHLYNIGLFYLNARDTVKAKNYIVKAYMVKKIPETTSTLAKLKYKEGNKKEALSLWNAALKSSSLEDKIKIKETMSNTFYENGEYKEAGLISQESKAMKDSLDRQRRTTKIQELQLEFEHNQEIKKKELVYFYTWLSLLIIIIAGTGALIYYIYRMKNDRNSYQDTINLFQNKINELEASGNNESKNVALLKKELTKLETKKKKAISKGLTLYSKIKDGDTTVKWDKDDFECFVEYYTVINTNFTTNTLAKYNNLSSANKFLLAMQDMQYNNEDICRILGFSAGALRGARHRIKGKLI